MTEVEVSVEIEQWQRIFSHDRSNLKTIILTYTQTSYFIKLTYSRLQNLLELSVINHISSEKRNIFVPWWLKLSHVLVVLQLEWLRSSLQLRWITRSG